jgi:small-conductance mechanosensitive channel
VNFDQFIETVARIYLKPLFVVAGTEVSLFSVFLFFLVIILSIIISLILQRTLKKSLNYRFIKQEGTLAAILRLIHYVVILVGFGIGLQTIGINISALFAAGAVFAIAMGFAMQNIVQNFVSGIILLVERSIKPGDILEVEGTVVKVIDMGIRTTVVRTWREEELIMPNSIFSQSTVKNYTLRDNEFRLGVDVGVSYGSDMKKVIEVLEETAKNVPWRLPDPEPRVLLLEFGNSSVNFGVYVNIDTPWRQRIYMSELRKAVWFAFKEANITIAFNQLDVHFDPPVTEVITGFKKVI